MQHWDNIGFALHIYGLYLIIVKQKYFNCCTFKWENCSKAIYLRICYMKDQSLLVKNFFTKEGPSATFLWHCAARWFIFWPKGKKGNLRSSFWVYCKVGGPIMCNESNTQAFLVKKDSRLSVRKIPPFWTEWS